jgi:hypothetical protein
MDNFDEKGADEFWSDSRIACPYCGKVQWYVDEAVSEEEDVMTCSDCLKDFTYWASYDVTYHSTKK